ncbi:cation diffusion facilitator family transporter [Mesorhizobium sp. C416B]|uniref:cation diffusion facilitator family transporter n=1 Tax=unclassified Mesorhizobium TaxID=325217 RepID=UPI0003CEDFA6|nr:MULTISPECIES: cation diffusion facilitator family transporter [unclassified Mesorhizobium]ESX49070.1 cobalt transporter [Mesorhizobium sp. LSHC426A00]ESX56168.1 cobalt transporter [Mesorhizobium sp. LSHC424B00]ESX73012.1 cobalt transporter [Mesorhizobium sp. LSHC416B00]ESZ41612.1 cobalt transporter [Mesorhizobium sp. L2C066B000]WJI61979.1 cation diffusion facilitator family transporter [Mesorhizobium sp. C416B]
MDKIRDWFGFGPMSQGLGGHGHDHGEGGHGHTHGVIDPTIATTTRGIWAIKWSFVLLAITAVLQLVVVFLSGSVALLADTIHNVGDAVTAIPLWVAFVLARRKPSKTFTYGLGRVEDLAGIIIVLIILFSAIVAGYEAIDRLIHPKPIAFLGWVAIAGLIGFLGNEAVAVFRIRVGREINSAALIADGYHARTDGFTSLAVVLGAIGVWLGFPLADPIIGLLITIAIFAIVWQSSKAVLTRMLDGVEPGIVEEIHHAAEHVRGIEQVAQAQARWIGHRLHADVAIKVADSATAKDVLGITEALRGELFDHLPALSEANIRLEGEGGPVVAGSGHAHHAPDPFKVACDLASGTLEIVDTPAGERMRLTIDSHADDLEATVIIERHEGPETLPLGPVAGDHHRLESSVAPAEPHEFEAKLILTVKDREQILPFKMVEPEGHHH